MALLDWEKLPVSVRRSRQKLYKHIQENVDELLTRIGGDNTTSDLNVWGKGDWTCRLHFGQYFEGYIRTDSNEIVQLIDGVCEFRFSKQALLNPNINSYLGYVGGTVYGNNNHEPISEISFSPSLDARGQAVLDIESIGDFNMISSTVQTTDNNGTLSFGLISELPDILEVHLRLIEVGDG